MRPSTLDSQDCLARQIEEVDALLAVFPEPGAVTFTAAEEIDFDRLRSASSAGALTASRDCFPDLSGTIRLLDCELNGEPVELRFTLPLTYPRDAPSLQVSGAADRCQYGVLAGAVRDCVAENVGSEVLLLALEALRTAAQSLPADEQADSAERDPPARDPGVSISRKLIWFHHIKSTTKRKNIVAWARELNLCGLCKPGFPGILICEGEDDDVKEFCGRVRSMRWQAMSIRAEETDPPRQRGAKPHPRFGGEFRELGEGDMDVLAAECRSAGLEHLFLADLKL